MAIQLHAATRLQASSDKLTCEVTVPYSRKAGLVHAITRLGYKPMAYGGEDDEGTYVATFTVKKNFNPEIFEEDLREANYNGSVKITLS